MQFESKWKVEQKKKDKLDKYKKGEFDVHHSIEQMPPVKRSSLSRKRANRSVNRDASAGKKDEKPTKDEKKEETKKPAKKK